MQSVIDPNRHEVYTPVNKEKYKGSKFPVCRSSWEKAFMQFLDTNNSVLEWGSELFSIPYFDIVKNKNRRYYPDFVFKAKSRDGSEQIYVVEIKPEKETKPPSVNGRKTQKSLIYEQKTWMNNQAKWRAALVYCQKKGFIFKIITEKSLFNK
jgi:hypothetical protein